ncbi:MAG TPA: TonB-dependent receptor [Kofleriaceae bacterium]|nr:TonB-dependent receptor [Kofleriaceae bacterium]
MKTNKLLLAMVLGTGGSLLAAGAATRDTRAQGVTSGAIQGRVTDAKTGDALAGVTVVATSGQSSQTAITEDDGTYKITELPPGDYLVTFFYGDVTIERKDINVGLQKTTPVFQKINTESATTETIVINDKPPDVDPTSTSQGITIDKEYTKNIPVPGRTFASTLGAAAGSQGDALGVAFSGSSSLENQYYVDGVNTTGLKYGTVGSGVLNDFIEETEVITGGYNAEYGRATGAVVNVVTKSGGNEFEGLVFAYVTPGFLTAATERAPTQASSIDARSDLGVEADVGFLLSGPIIKDKLWYVVAAAPSYTYNNVYRTTKRQIDSDNANGPDIDPETGFRIYEDISTRVFKPWAGGVSGLAKLNYALSPEHQGQLSFQGGPTQGRSYAIYGLPAAGDFQSNAFTSDVAAKWTSKFNDNKTEVEGVLGWHYDKNKVEAVDPTARTTPQELLLFGNLGEWSKLGFEDEATKLACQDGGNDPFPAITNCPDLGVGYRVGGGGGFDDTREGRYAGKLSLTQRVKALGTHEVKAGVDGEINTLSEPRVYTGGAFFQNRADTKTIRAFRWVQVAPADSTDPAFDRMCPYTPVGQMSTVEIPCRFIGQGEEGSEIQGQTADWAAYLRDSWQIRPNLTLNAGLRYEEQYLRYAKFLQDDVNPNTGKVYGKNAMSMKGMLAPRIGLLYDWTREGRSKVYGHWGRFYESIPMDINSRSFGGEVSLQQDFAWNNCGASVPGYGGPSSSGCPTDTATGGTLIGVGGTEVAPGIKPQYMDETIFGVEYELMEDLKIGISAQSRSLKRVIEDVSTDGAATYIIANPGEWSDGEQAKLQKQIDDATAAGDSAEAQRLTKLMRLFTGIRMFDPPSRRYDALQFTVTRRFSKSFYMQGSYTYSRTVGNYPGLISYDNGQVDPNISSQYDLIELLSNREGPLPQDRPHYIKLDGYYTFDFKKAGRATLGWRARALSGVPRNALAGHPLYGIGESFLLPRGEIGRTNFETSLDLHAGYARQLAKGMELELFADVFNVLDDQGTFSVDEDYTYQSDANPIVGGTYEDVVFAKALDMNGFETPDPVIRNPNFGNTAGRYAPLSARFGARLTF